MAAPGQLGAVGPAGCRRAAVPNDDHDEHYFRHPDQITGDLPPRPYADLHRVEILRRSYTAEILRRAFRHL